MRQLRNIGLIAVASVILSAGCGKEANSAPAGGGAGQNGTEKPAGTRQSGGGGGMATAAGIAVTPTSQHELDMVKKPAKPYKIVLIVKTRNNPFFDPMIKAFEEEARTLGAVPEVQAPQQEGDKEVQFSYVQNMAAKGVDAILIAPADSKAIIPALKAAQAKGIIIVNLDNRVDKGAADAAGYMVDGYVGADNKEGGKLAGTMMVKALGGKGKVAVIEGIRGVDNAEARRAGFEKGVEGKLDIVAKESANWKMDEASNKVQSILAAHPEITGIFCANDMMALGAAKAVKQAGKTGKIKIIGYDNIKEAQDAIKAGEMYATIEQHPELMGRYGAKMGVGLLTQFTQKYREFLVPLEAKTK